MIKINYPTGDDLKEFEYHYRFIFEEHNLQQKFKDLCSKESLINLAKINVEDLIISDFEQLISVSDLFDNSLKNVEEAKVNEIKDQFIKLFNYSNFQPKIANHFDHYSEKLGLSTCYFCNIDYINTFTDFSTIYNLSDFIDIDDLLKNGSKNHFMLIKNIGKSRADSIIQKRNELLAKGKKINLINMESEGVKTSIIEFLKKTDLTIKTDNTANHFTLDHIINKADYPIVGLSLYNLLPCCYACNSKFKRNDHLIDVSNESDSLLSPTSKNFTFNEDNKFSVFFNSTNINFSHIKNNNDFSLRLLTSTNHDQYNKYIKLFKLNERYAVNFHKQDVTDLTQKSQRYNKVKIKQIAELLGCTQEQVKTDIFGAIITEKNLAKMPKAKLIQDIAKLINLTD